jgi:DNA-binding NtrC family response regulator
MAREEMSSSAKKRLLRLVRESFPLDQIQISAAEEGIKRLQGREASETAAVLEDSIEQLPQALDQLEAELSQYEQPQEANDVYVRELISSSPATRTIYRLVDKIAATNAPVFLTGETGTGKSSLAREIHRRSRRSDKPFVSIDCAAIPEELLKTELFGHPEGTFAINRAVGGRGLLREAAGGTLFLDEISAMPLAIQEDILRVVEGGAVAPVGTTQPQAFSVRILASTVRDLEAQVKSRLFRKDLYYRLAALKLHLPSLRERGDDLLMIAQNMVRRAARVLLADVRGFTPEAIAAMQLYSWPGNLRELENRIMCAVGLAEGPLLTDADLRLSADLLPQLLPLDQANRQFEREYIKEVLTLCGENHAKAARVLRIASGSLRQRLAKLAST